VLKKLLNKVAIKDRTCLLACPKVGITQKTFQASGPFVLLHVHEFVLKKLLNKVLIKDQTSSLTCRKVPRQVCSHTKKFPSKPFRASVRSTLLHVDTLVLKKLLNKEAIKDQTCLLEHLKVDLESLRRPFTLVARSCFCT
jgi:hypothetical protein